MLTRGSSAAGDGLTELAARLKVLAVASGGGHWVQLQRLRGAVEDHDVTYVSTRPDVERDVDGRDFRLVPDANRWQKVRLVRCAVSVAWVLVTVRPDVVVTTGAAPGYIAVRLGGMLGARTIWIDSVANADELSLSGERALEHVDLCITQWEHLARPDGPRYFGSVFG